MWKEIKKWGVRYERGKLWNNNKNTISSSSDNMLGIGMKDNEIMHDLLLMTKYQAKEEMELIITKIENKEIETPEQENKFMRGIMKKYCKLYQKMELDSQEDELEEQQELIKNNKVKDENGNPK